MINGQSVLAVIPARGGSKRVPGKNLRDYRGAWLVEYAIKAADGSQYIDEFVVSSDDEAILDRAYKCGAMTLERPAWLATDAAMNEGVMIHTLYTHRWADWCVLLQPTSPQSTSADIDTCIERAQHGVGCISYDEYGKRNGAVYVVKSEHLVAAACFSLDVGKIFYTMPNDRSLDIDYEVDFAR